MGMCGSKGSDLWSDGSCIMSWTAAAVHGQGPCTWKTKQPPPLLLEAGYKHCSACASHYHMQGTTPASMQNSANWSFTFSCCFFLLLFIRHENRMAHFLPSSSGRIQHNNSLNTIRFQIWIYMTSHLDLSVFHVFGSREMFCICTAQNNYLPSMQMISPIDPIKLDSFPPPLEKQLHKTPDYRVWWPICLIFISSRVQTL